MIGVHGPARLASGDCDADLHLRSSGVREIATATDPNTLGLSLGKAEGILGISNAGDATGRAAIGRAAAQSCGVAAWGSSAVLDEGMNAPFCCIRITSSRLSNGSAELSNWFVSAAQRWDVVVEALANGDHNINAAGDAAIKAKKRTGIRIPA